MAVKKPLPLLAFIMASSVSEVVEEAGHLQQTGAALPPGPAAEVTTVEHREAATAVEPRGEVTVVEHTGATTVAEPSVTKAKASKRQRRDPGTATSSESEPEAGPLWQVGSDSGWDNAIWWKDCSEPFQAALEAQYQAKRRKVTHECTQPNGRKVLFTHNLVKMLQTNQSNSVTKMLRRIAGISLPLRCQ